MKLREIMDSDSRKVKNSVTICAVILFLVFFVSMPALVSWAVGQIISLQPAGQQESTQTTQTKTVIPAGGVVCTDYNSASHYSALKRNGYFQYRDMPENINCKPMSKTYLVTIKNHEMGDVVELETYNNNGMGLWTVESEIKEVDNWTPPKR